MQARCGKGRGITLWQEQAERAVADAPEVEEAALEVGAVRAEEEAVSAADAREAEAFSEDPQITVRPVGAFSATLLEAA